MVHCSTQHGFAIDCRTPTLVQVAIVARLIYMFGFRPSQLLRYRKTVADFAGELLCRLSEISCIPLRVGLIAHLLSLRNLAGADCAAYLSSVFAIVIGR